jgi:DNA-binding response OmpR family regulator
MPRILIVDDNDDIRSMLELILQREGFDVASARDGEQALALYAERAADIVITDLFMPERDGIETIVALRDRYPEAKIIAMSGWQSQRGPDYLAVAREIGAAGTLRKPFEPRELLRLVRRIGAEG